MSLSIRVSVSTLTGGESEKTWVSCASVPLVLMLSRMRPVSLVVMRTLICFEISGVKRSMSMAVTGSGAVALLSAPERTASLDVSWTQGVGALAELGSSTKGDWPSLLTSVTGPVVSRGLMLLLARPLFERLIMEADGPANATGSFFPTTVPKLA